MSTCGCNEETEQTCNCACVDEQWVYNVTQRLAELEASYAQTKFDLHGALNDIVTLKSLTSIHTGTVLVDYVTSLYYNPGVITVKAIGIPIYASPDLSTLEASRDGVGALISWAGTGVFPTTTTTPPTVAYTSWDGTMRKAAGFSGWEMDVTYLTAIPTAGDPEDKWYEFNGLVFSRFDIKIMPATAEFIDGYYELTISHEESYDTDSQSLPKHEDRYYKPITIQDPAPLGQYTQNLAQSTADYSATVGTSRSINIIGA